jgi:hypothetical protein
MDHVAPTATGIPQAACVRTARTEHERVATNVHPADARLRISIEL